MAHKWTPNRIVALGTGAIGVAIAAASLAAAEGGPQAAGVAAGVLAFVVPAREWLIGWREFEARQGEAEEPVSWADLAELPAPTPPRPTDPAP
jgi:hypothetical protein